MSSVTSQLIVRLIDQVTGPASAAGRALQRLMAQSNARAGTGISAINGQLQTIATRSQQIATQAGNLSQNLSGPLAIIGTLGARAAYDFEKAGNLMQALGEATAEQRREFERYANTVNSEFPQSLAEITRTANEMLKAGFSFQQMMGSLRQTLAATLLEPEMKPSDFANMMSSAINAFQLPMQTFEQAMQSSQTVTDRMVYAALKTQTTLRGMGDTFRYVAGAASAASLNIDQVTAMAMALAKQGTIGSEAGVTLRSAIVRLSKPTAQGLAAMERIGLRLSDYQVGRQQITTDRIMSGLLAGGIDATPIRRQLDELVRMPELQNAPLQMAARVTAALQEHFKTAGSAIDAQTIATNVQESIVAAGSKIDLVRFFEDFKKKMAAGLAQNADLMQILEGRHFSRNMALLSANLPQLIADIQREATGTTVERAMIANQGVVGAVRDFSAALEGLAVAFARSALPEITAGLKSASEAIKGFGEANPALLKAILVTGAAIVALAPIGMIAAGVAAAFKLIAAAATTVAAVMAPAAAPIIAVAAALAGLAVYAYRNWDGLTSFASSFASTIAEKFPNVAAAIGWVGGKIGDLVGWFDRLLGKSTASTEQWAAWGKSAAEAVSNAVDAVTSFVSNLGTRIKDGINNGAMVIVEFGRRADASFAEFVAAVKAKVDEIVAFLQALPGKMAAAVSTGAAALYAAGANLIQSLLDGIKAKVAELMAFVSGIPGRITGALSGIRIPGFGGGAAAPGGATQGPARAGGGRVNEGTVYGVGERGRELFVPDSNGTILANRGRTALGAGSPGRPSVTQNNTFNVTVNGAGQDAAKLAQTIKDEVERSIDAQLRGLQSDYGAAFA